VADPPEHVLQEELHEVQTPLETNLPSRHVKQEDEVVSEQVRQLLSHKTH
jgi:hypothetical protein